MRLIAAVLYGAVAITATAADTTSVPGKASEPASRGYIALLLPTKSKSLKPATDQIRAGVLAAERAHGNGDIPPVRLYETTDSETDVLAQLQKAQADGARAVIGPLSKTAVNYVADVAELTVPVLALNSFDNTTLQQPNLYSFNLSIEAEAAQLAQSIHEGGLTRPVVLQGDGALPPRMVQGFIEGWMRVASAPPVIIDLADPQAAPGSLATLLADNAADAVILAMTGKQARLIRPYLGNERLVFATSQIDTGNLKAAIDLAGIRFLDMPWLATPELEEYAVYQRKRAGSADLERLFALGVDAWRIAAALATANGEKEWQGISGRLAISDNGQISRELVLRTVPGRPLALNPASVKPASEPAAASPVQ